MQTQGPNAEDYPPFYKRFLQNPFGPHYFNWLPIHIFSPTDIAAIQLLEKPRDFFRYLNNYVPKFRKPPPQLQHKSWNKNAKMSPIIPNIFAEQKEQLMRKAIIALRLRAAFRRLVHLWIWRKAARATLPETDIITMAPFRDAVLITDMGQRRSYKFEASAIIAHIETQINYVSYGFVKSMHPRNPITNLPFSSAQLVEIYKQCIAYGRVNASFAAFASCKFNLERYYIINKRAITLQHNMQSVTQPTNETGHEMLIECIEHIAELLEYDLGDKDINRLTYGLAHFPEHPYFKKWRRIFIAKLFCDEDSFEDKILFFSLMDRAKSLLDIRKIVINEFRHAKFAANNE